jgi:hypothetical protein
VDPDAGSSIRGTGWQAGTMSDSIGPLNQWPRGHLIFALSSGPSEDQMM